MVKKTLKRVEEESIEFIQLWFTDIVGSLKSFSLPSGELEDALVNGKGFDGSSIEGFTRIHESDMVAKPDPSTFQILPWSSEGCREARMFCDVLEPSGKPYEGDPRYVLKRNLGRAKELGFDFFVGPELEYFYFRSPKSPEVLDWGGYFDRTPPDLGDELRRKTIIALEEMGIQTEYSHHEVAPSQHEIDLRYQDALTMADCTMTYKLVVKEIAQQNGVYATFMPKPIYGINGTGMHCHLSLFKEGRNAFFDEKDKYGLSEVARGFIAGLLRHAREITLVTNQWVNSYKRLVIGYEAPVYVSWAQRNRSTLIRVPLYRPGSEKDLRIEYRSPDPACNPYLAFAVMLGAGLEGVEKGYELPEAVEVNVYELGLDELRLRGITLLPGSIIEAILEAEQSELVKKTLGEDIFDKFLKNKKAVWEDYRSTITSYELEKDLPVL